ncbi:VOC family protein [Paenibacillus sp. GYB003]|uniref:VOC family protein n=1 Tax=Paenibacillus sp. GYB003 TaxID=2994392 RepID=UPI002F96DF94
MPNSYTPRRFHTATPYFQVKGADKLIDFMKAAFGAELLNRSNRDDGSVRHAEVLIGDTVVELSEAGDRFAARPSTIHLFVADTDGCYRRALEAGATSLYEPADMPYGERSAGVEDPHGNHWYIATFTAGEGKGYYND